ncbi:hypothetical protein CAP31_03895 [Sulfuriferula sp. AH1]|uniref:hypothetical protein n=1 Tax=Sulfuriferula sp. AH1 TaxID=1985873 RepID=UPI000B3B9F8B|nr:hypothetical protein [Sulfuriferula sp. AH1]ARU30903.1 hypothetical protein CAP31_03895 [Sulfuriferula sp. AH1]
MMLMFEISRPFRAKPKMEKYGILSRWIWLWFSVAYLDAGFNDITKQIRLEERARIVNNLL